MTCSVLCLLLAAACATWGGASNLPDLSQTQPATQRQIEATLDDLPDALDAAFRQLEWARVQFRDTDAGKTATAVVPDGRQAHITITPVVDDPHLLQIEVRVGRFGAPALQQRFLDAIERHLRRHDD